MEFKLHVFGNLVESRRSQILRFAGVYAVRPFQDFLEEAQVVERSSPRDGNSDAGQLITKCGLVGAAQPALCLHFADRGFILERFLHVEDNRQPVTLIVGFHCRVKEEIVGLQNEVGAHAGI